MEFFTQFIDFVLHLDRHLVALIGAYGYWVYGILFLIIYGETGLVVMPFLPGDSLLFVVGALAATGALDVQWVIVLLMTAAFLGDNTNYWIGRFLGPKVFTAQSRWLNRRHLDKTEAFYEKHGGKTVLLARFLPIIRTFAPFVAGIGRMRYGRFVLFSILGAVAWINSLVFAGYFFGNIPLIKNNLTVVILIIVALSFMPAMIHFVRERARR
ncbi:MAG: DedA family protein [Burkholderiales bacterium]